MTKQELLTGPRRDPNKVSIFNPYADGDIVSIAGKDWQIKNDGGWYLTSTGNWRGEHPTIKKVAAMTDLIGMIWKEVNSKQVI